MLPSDHVAIARDQGFFAAGLDSVRTVQLGARLHEILGQPFPTTVALKYPTVDTLADHILHCLLDDVSAAPGGPADSEAADLVAESWAEWNDLSSDQVADRLAAKLISLGTEHGHD